jgi:hypothetical protein
MNRSARVLAAVLTTAALSLAGPGLQAASAKPHPAGAHAKGGPAAAPKGGPATAAKGDVVKVLRDIARTSKALDRTVRDNRVGTLADDVRTAVVGNVDADKAALAELATAVSAPESTLDPSQVRRDLRQLRPENYVLAVNVLRKAARVAAAATDNAEATALVDSAVATALTVTAASPKSLLREARADLADAQALLDTDVDEEPAAPVEPVEPVEPAAPVTT